MERSFLELLLDCMQKRRSVRKYSSKDVSDEMVGKILQAATFAPSAGNVQPWFFYVCRNTEKKKKLTMASSGQGFVAQAPVVIVVCAVLEQARDSYRQRGEQLYCIQDTAAAIQNMLLVIHALGLGACWVGAFDEAEVRAALSLPPNLRPVAILPIGYGDEQVSAPGRRSVEEVSKEIL
jgi:nitroreductase